MPHKRRIFLTRVGAASVLLLTLCHPGTRASIIGTVAKADSEQAEVHAPGGNGPARGTQKSREYVLNVMRSLRGHLHNKFVHVPIGFSLAAFFLLVVRRGRIDPGIRLLVLIAACGAIVTYFSGVQQSAVYEGGTKDWVIALHERFGITTLAILWVWAAVTWSNRLQRWAIVVGSMVMLALIVTGFLGGVIAHG